MKKATLCKALAILVTAMILTPTITALAAETTPYEPKHTTGQTIADGTGSISDTPLTYKLVDGKDLAREDFSQNANPAIFTGQYTRGMYNAAYQSYHDRAYITPQNNEKRFNPYYSYASAVIPSYDGSNKFDAPLSDISRMYSFRTDAEPYAADLWKHPGYFIVTVKQMEYTLDKATEDAIAAVKDMSVRDKVITLNKYLQTRLVYDSKSAASIEKVFTSKAPVRGACGTYAYAFQFLCEKAGIPCVSVSGDNHGWTMVYIDGKWLHCDPTNSRTTNDGLLKETIRFKPTDPQRLEFAKEIVVPGSTK